VELAYWCLRQDLLARAERELNDVRTLDSGHPALRSLDLQLQQLVQIKNRPPAPAPSGEAGKDAAPANAQPAASSETKPGQPASQADASDDESTDDDSTED